VRDEVPDAVGEAIVDWTSQNDPVSRAEFDRLNSVLIRSVGEAAEHEEYGRNQHLRQTDAETAGVFAFDHDVALARLDDDIEYVDLHGYALEEGFVPILVCLAGDIDDVADRQHRLYHLVDNTSPCECRAVTDGVPLEDCVSRFLDRYPDASIPMIAGGVNAPPSAVAEVLDENTPESGEHSSSRTGDRVSRPFSRSRQDRLRRSCNTGQWEDADFPTPESGIFPPGQFERVQWMGHQQKKPFAPWGDRNAPAPCSKNHHPETAADCECDARYKWGYDGHYLDGKTAQMAEVDPRLDGLAYIQLPDDPYVYVDGDDVRDPETGDVHPALIAILEHLGLTYADVSQSGKGVHAIYKGDLPDGVKQASWRLDEDPWESNEDLPSIEVYPGKRVCVMTGAHVPGTPTEIAEWNDDVLDALLEANDQVAINQRDNADRDDVLTAREDYDLEDYEPAATASSETTDDIRDVFAALDRLDARRVAERTIIHRWNDDASTSDGYRAFYPTWGKTSNGTANVVNDQIWQDTGDLGGYGGPVVMSLIDIGEMRPSNASPRKATGRLWFQGIEHLQDLGFDIPTLVPPTPDSESANSEWTVEECEPPPRDAETFDREQRWAELQGERFDDVLEHDGIDLWSDEAGAGKTTNAPLGALKRDQGHAIYFDKHEKAREFTKDDAIQDFEGDALQDAEYFHMKGGEQKRHGHCMDADHADEDCPEHGHPSQCPSMCPIYDLDPEHETRQAYEALVREVGPNKAHQILDLHEAGEYEWHGEECAWQAQYSAVESEPFVVGVHPYVIQKSVRSGLNIIDETPDLHSRETTAGPTELTRIANTLERIADLRARDDPVAYTARELARFTRDVVDVIADVENADGLKDLTAPTITWNAYETYDDAAGHYLEQEQPEGDWQLAEALAKAKVAHGETVLTRMQNDNWEGTPISIDAVLAAAVEAGLDEEPVMQAVALSPIIDNCPWCHGELKHHNGARCCASDDCDWHEAEHALIHQGAEPARASAWFATDPSDAIVALRYRELPLTSELPAPEDTLVLDATATPDKVATLFGVDRDEVRVAGDDPLEIPNLHTTQVLDGQYHAGTIRSALEDDGSLAGRIQRAIDTAADVHEKPLYIVKSDLIPEFDFPERGEVLHYHATRGLNRNDCDAVMCIGAPHPDVEDLKRDAQLLAMARDDVAAGGAEHSTRRGAENPPVYRKLHYEDDAGRGRAVPTKHYTGLVGTLFRESREKELVQALHRIRPLIADEAKHAYLLTNVPTEIPVDEPATFEDLADPLEAIIDVPSGAVDLLKATHDVVAGDGPNGFRAGQLVEECDGVVSNKVDGYYRLAQLSGLDVSKRTVYNWVNALKEVGLLRPEGYEQHAGVSYAVDTATLKSALSVLSHNGGFKVAAVRRFRRIIADSTSGFDWLEWARDAFTLQGNGEIADSPPAGGGLGT